jgi:hypothetical protein
MADRLAVADWVPGPVADTASRLYAATRSSRRKAVIARLVSHEDMRRVWRTLRENYHGKVKPVAWPQTVAERGRCAAIVFDVATQTDERAYDRRMVAAFQFEVRDIAARAETLLDDVATVRRWLSPFIIEVDDEIRALGSLITKCRDSIDNSKALLVVSHKTTRHRGYLSAVAGAMQENFGTVMLTTVATIATVALDRKVTVPMVKRTLRPTDGE